jgi:beta-galactosidase
MTYSVSGNDGGYYPTGLGWYRKAFTVPAAWKGKQVGIYFEGVYMDSEVFINGESLGIRPYGGAWIPSGYAAGY